MAGPMEAGTEGSWSGAALLASARMRWEAMQPSQRRLLSLSLGALLVLSGVSAWWGMKTDWRVLFSGMEGRDAAAMQQQLSAAGIRYQTTPDGASIQVPAEQLDKARVAISTSGLPQSGRLGFELFDKPNWVGSEFDERVNYQRALEGELQHTFESLESVRSARVHIVLPKQGSFAAEDQPAKASVVLKLRRTNLPREQSEAMRNMVAASVEGLKPDAVTLVDADGRTDFSPLSASAEERDGEQALANKLTQVLEPLAGSGNVHATVSISFIQGSEAHTDEVYDPQGATPLSSHRMEQISTQARPGGIAGTQSNTPAAAPTANNVPANMKPPGAVNPPLNATNSQSQNSHDETTQYAVTRHVTHTEEMPGRVRRVTAAVVVNDREVRQQNGKTTHTAWQHRTRDEMKQLQTLAEAAIGFDGKRGDSVVLENVAFSGNGDIPEANGLSSITEPATDLLRAQPALPRAVASFIGILVMGLLVLRPLARQAQILLSAPIALPLLASSTSKDVEELNASTNTAASVNTQHIFDRVTEQIRTETQGSTRLIGSWIAAGSEDRD